MTLLFLLSEENEVRTMVDPNSKNDRKLQELMKVGVESQQQTTDYEQSKKTTPLTALITTSVAVFLL